MVRRTPPLNTLRAFEAAARIGNFARAADELSVTAAAISHRIKELEAFLDVRLFERKARGVTLTEAGARYHKRIAGAFDEIERATAQAGEASIDGPLTVSMPESFAHAWFAPRVARLAQRLPGLVLTMEGDSRLSDLRRGTVDVALRMGLGDYAGLTSELIMGDAVTVVAAPALLQRHPGAPLSSLVHHVSLLEDAGLRPGETWSAWGPWLREAGISASLPKRQLRFSDSAMMLTACEASAGLCVARLSIAFNALQRNALQALLPWRSADFACHLVTRPADEHTPRVLAFRSWLHSEAADFADHVGSVTGVRLACPA